MSYNDGWFDIDQDRKKLEENNIEKFNLLKKIKLFMKKPFNRSQNNKEAE